MFLFFSLRKQHILFPAEIAMADLVGANQNNTFMRSDIWTNSVHTHTRVFIHIIQLHTYTTYVVHVKFTMVCIVI